MKQSVLRAKIPLKYVKPICIAAALAGKGRRVAMVEKSDRMYGGTCINIACIPTKTLVGILFLAAGLWLAGLCMLLGSYILEKSSYRCPHCGRKLDMKYPLPKGSCCPFCRGGLRK